MTKKSKIDLKSFKQKPIPNFSYIQNLVKTYLTNIKKKMINETSNPLIVFIPLTYKVSRI